VNAFATARLEDLTFLADHGVGFTEAAQRVGVSVRSLERWLRNHHQTSLKNRLRANEPHPSPRWADEWTKELTHG
jgi:transposase